MSGRRIRVRGDGPESPAPEPEDREGWESLAEESEGRIAPSPELEEALREAAEAVEGRERGRERPAAEPAAPGGEAAAGLEGERDRYLRLLADFENFRRRAARERLEVEQYGHQNLVKDLLTVVDNLERAIEHTRRGPGGGSEGLLEGVELVRRDLVAALGKHGVTALEAVGRPFDPGRHEAMAQVADDSRPPNTVVEELQRGYLLRDRLLRASRVVVSRRSESGDGGGQEAAG